MKGRTNYERCFIWRWDKFNCYDYRNVSTQNPNRPNSFCRPRRRTAAHIRIYRDFENIQRSNEEFDGLVVLLSLWAYDNHASYHLHNWDPADDERMMMAIYYAEQVHPFPRYKNDLVKFKADWAAQAYDPGGASLTFAPADVEELEVLCEEATEPEPPAPPAPKRKKHKRRRK